MPIVDPFAPAPVSPPPPPATPEQLLRQKEQAIKQAANRFARKLKEQAKGLKDSDTEFKTLLWAPGNVYTGEELFAELVSQGIVTPDVAQDMALVVKAFIERYWPGTYAKEDTVPLMTITLTPKA